MEGLCTCGKLKSERAKTCKSCYHHIQKIEAKVKATSVLEVISERMKKQHSEARHYKGTRITDVFSEMGSHFHAECPSCGLPLEKDGSCSDCR